MSRTVHCDVHGNRDAAFLCIHLTARDQHAQGFNHSAATDDMPFPDAWCDNCEIIRAQAGGWNNDNGKLAQVKAVCAGCYNDARIRNTKPDVTLAELADLKWKCGSCDEWHTGPCLDFGYDHPDMWHKEDEEQAEKSRLLPSTSSNRKTWRDADYAVQNDEHFFVRGLIRLPIIGTNDFFCWGVWGSLSRDNFYALHKLDGDEKRTKLGPLFSWLCNWIPEYGEVADIKMYLHPQAPGLRPHFELEHTDHPLAKEFHHGILPSRVKEIMLNRLRK